MHAGRGRAVLFQGEPYKNRVHVGLSLPHRALPLTLGRPGSRGPQTPPGNAWPNTFTDAHRRTKITREESTQRGPGLRGEGSTCDVSLLEDSRPPRSSPRTLKCQGPRDLPKVLEYHSPSLAPHFGLCWPPRPGDPTLANTNASEWARPFPLAAGPIDSGSVSSAVNAICSYLEKFVLKHFPTSKGKGGRGQASGGTGRAPTALGDGEGAGGKDGSRSRGRVWGPWGGARAAPPRAGERAPGPQESRRRAGGEAGKPTPRDRRGLPTTPDAIRDHSLSVPSSLEGARQLGVSGPQSCRRTGRDRLPRSPRLAARLSNIITSWVLRPLMFFSF